MSIFDLPTFFLLDEWGVHVTDGWTFSSHLILLGNLGNRIHIEKKVKWKR